MKTVKKLALLIPVIIAAVCFFAFTGADSDKIRISEKELGVVAETADGSLLISTAKRSEMKEIASSGMLKMYLDEKTMTVCIYDVISGALYRSLPEKYYGEKPSALSVNVLLEGREYTLSSQSDSLSFDCTDYELTDKGVTITYSFRRSLEGKNKLDISIPVSYALTDGMLTVGVDCDKIHCGGKTVITSVSLLEFFGADSDAKKGDYILLPEGCGAMVDLSEKAESFEEVSLPVYGGDPAVSGERGYNVPIGAFGRKSSDSAFVCLVSEGEALCEITARKALEKEGYNRVNAVFNITPAEVKDKYIYVSEKTYEGTLQLCYRFLNGDNANYIGMASAVRELLIRQSKLRENSTHRESYYPFNLSLVMSEETEDEKGKPQVKTLTSYTQANELLASLKAKGFGDMNVRLTGVYNRGDIKVFGAKDNSDEKTRMLSNADDGSIRFFADSRLLGGESSFVISLDGEKLPYANMQKIKGSLSGYIGEIRRQNIYGVCIDDAGAILTSDFSKGELSLRENVKNSLSEIFSAICASKSLMTSGGNLYGVKYADCVIDLPDAAALAERDCISAVPFIQAILHGITDYSHPASNLSADSTLAMLRAVEYGALPHYEWHCTPSGENEAEDKHYYMNSVSQAKAFYDKMKADFADLRGKRITAHKKVKEDVYLTRFGEDCSVYVNYSDNAVSVTGITVNSKSYAVVN